VKETLKSGKFWLGIVLGVLLLAFFPQLNPRVALTAKRAGS
jgi:hypothetical protein